MTHERFFDDDDDDDDGGYDDVIGWRVATCCIDDVCNDLSMNKTILRSSTLKETEGILCENAAACQILLFLSNYCRKGTHDALASCSCEPHNRIVVSA